MAPPATWKNAFPNSKRTDKDCGPPNQSPSGATIGGTIGYNHQIDRFVIGVEVDFNFANISDSKRDGNYLVETSNIEHTATIRARAGVLLTPAVLAYATGGVAFQDLEYGESCPPDASAVIAGWCRPVSVGGHGPYSLKKSQWNTGYVVGGGFEWLLTERVSLKVEGLYSDFGTNSYQLGLMGDGKPLPLKHRVVGKISWSKVPGLVFIDVPEEAADPWMTVLKVKLDGKVKLYRGQGGF